MQAPWLLTAAFLALCSCGRHAATPPTPTNSETLEAAGRSTKDSCATAVNRFIDHAEVSVPSRPTWKRAMTTRCIEDHWTGAVVECVATSDDADAYNGCAAMMTEAQRIALANMPSE
jgi:hypothetical protein